MEMGEKGKRLKLNLTNDWNDFQSDVTEAAGAERSSGSEREGWTPEERSHKHREMIY